MELRASTLVLNVVREAAPPARGAAPAGSNSILARTGTAAEHSVMCKIPPGFTHPTCGCGEGSSFSRRRELSRE